MTQQRKRGRVPSYWWDICLETNEIIIETDDPRTPPIIDRFQLSDDRDADFDKASAIVKEWQAGRRIWRGNNDAG